MNTRNKCSACMALCMVLIIVSGFFSCGRKSPAPDGVAGAGADAGAEITAEAKVEAAEPAEEAGKPPKSPDERCFGDFLIAEAGRREKERSLEPFFAGARRVSLMIELIDFTVKAAAERKYGGVSQGLAQYLESLKPLKPDMAEDEIGLVENIVSRRLGAYAACMAAAARDSSYCADLEKPWKDRAEDCHLNYEYNVLIAQKAVGSKGSCKDIQQKYGVYEDAMKGKFLEICEAVVKEDPKLCPGEETSGPDAPCRIAASRARSSVCGKADFKGSTNSYNCCETFGWHFSKIVLGKESSTIIPEMGALSGDGKGCSRALEWGLMEDLGMIFNAEMPEKLQKKPESWGQYLCPLIIYWSGLEPP
ncbi:MAG: hypothetical protein ABIJ56_16475 [Pseudomonadota bacterium]